MKYKDMKQAVTLLENEWNLGEKECGAPRRLCAWIYMMEILEETERFVYYRENQKLLGFAGYSKNNSKKYLLRKKLAKFIKSILYKSKSIKNVNALKEYNENYSYTPEHMKNDFDGEVSILILDKKYRGKGIGKRLLTELFDLAQKDNIKTLQILTDESCNYRIYENLGCIKVYETIVENKEYDKLENIVTEKAFIYKKEL